MKTFKKRTLSGAMAGVLALSLAVPAFAADETIISGSYQATDIDVVVPSKGSAFINPYALDIQVSQDPTDDTNTNKVTISGQQIVSAPMAIKNQSAMKLQVGATVTGEVKTGSMRFATESAAESTAKTAYVYLQAKQETSLSGADSAVSAAAIATAYAAWEPEDYDSDTDVVVSDREATTENLVTLNPAIMGNDGAFASYKAGSVGLLRLSGDCPTSPRDAWSDGSDSSNPADTFEVTVAYTFSPVAIEKFDITLNTPTFESPVTAAPTVTADVATAAEGDTVTLTVVKAARADILTVTVKDGENNPIEVSDSQTVASDSTGKTVAYTFTMPGSAVTVDVAAA